MHDLEFNHMHMAPEEVNEVAWAAENVELTPVGIDIGCSTSHLMFAQVHLQRLGTALSSRFVVVNRRIIWQSPILLTPYLPDFTIDIDELGGFIGGCYQYAGVDPADVDSGAVILTGEAIKRRNARAIADLFSEEAGRFVCASAGHHMECQLSAHGSGGVAEYLYKRETRQFGDLGSDLAHELAHMLAQRRDLPPVWDPGQGIRATVIGAAQFSVQTSGNTIAISKPDELPLHNLPVLACDFALGDTIDADAISAAVRNAISQSDIEEGSGPVALAFPWRGDPSHA